MEDLAGQRQHRHRPRGLRARDGRPAREGARRQHVQGRRQGAGAVDEPPELERTLDGDRRPVRGLRRDARHGRAGRRALRRAGRAGRRRCARAPPATSRWRGRRSTSRPAARSPTRGRICRRRRLGSRRRAHGPPGRDGRGCTRSASSSGALRARTDRHRGGHRRGARRDAAQSHGDAPAARGAARRCSARTSSRRDRSSRPIGCGSTSCTSPR